MKVGNKQDNGGIIQSESTLEMINSLTIVRLPKSASSQLPSRGIVMVRGVINEIPFKKVLEPDGKGGHWFAIDDKLLEKIGNVAGETLSLSVIPSKEWIEPEIPTDIQNARESSPKAYAVWNDTTPMARWDWLRWIRFTENLETRAHRIDVTISKLSAGKKRPCCFNRNMCTVQNVCYKGLLSNS